MTDMEETTEDGFEGRQIKVDVVGRIFAKGAQRLQEQIINSLLTNLVDTLIQDVDLELTDSQIEVLREYRPKVSYYSRKPVTEEERCQGITKAGTPCRNRHKEGYDYCMTHLRSHEEAVGTPYAERITPTASQNTPTNKVKSKPNIQSTATTSTSEEPTNNQPSYQPLRADQAPPKRTKPRIQQELESATETIDFSQPGYFEWESEEYLRIENRLFKLPEDFDPENSIEEDKLDLVGILQSNGTPVWKEE